MKLLKSHVVILSLGLLALSACSPKVYVIDNQTVLEEEAAGSWPKFEKQVLDKAKAKGPTPVSQLPPSKARKRLYNVLNGDMQVLASGAEVKKTDSKAGAAAGAVK